MFCVIFLIIGIDPSVDGREIAAAVQIAESENTSANVAKAAHTAAIVYHRWTMRVASYLAFCVNEGILGPTKFSLADLSEAVGLVGPEADKVRRHTHLDSHIHNMYYIIYT